MSTSDPSGTQAYPDEEELRAAYEAEIKRLRVEHVMLENVVTMVNLGMRRTGLMSGTEEERDPAQVRLAIESVRALLPLLQPSVGGEQVEQIQQALSQLQMAYVQIAGGAEAAPEAPAPGVGGSTPPAATPEPPKPGEPGPAQTSGRLWVPGQ